VSISSSSVVKLLYRFIDIKYDNPSVERNLSHPSNVHMPAKIANVVGQAADRRQQPQRAVPPVGTRQPAVQNPDEEGNDAEEEVSCSKEAGPNANSQLDLSSRQQREVAVLMGDTPSPAASVISIRSELTDEEDEDPHRCHVSG